jgi:hypothetical protein
MDMGEDAWTPDEALAASRGDRDRTLQAIHRLEEALAMAVGGTSWLEEVAADIRNLEMAMVAEKAELDRPDSLLAMVAAENPRRFRSLVRNIHDQYTEIIGQVTSLGEQLGWADEGFDPMDLRQRAGWIVRALRYCRARQADLVYEALALDLGRR